MISFSPIDIFIIVGFLITVVLIGLYGSRNVKKESEEYLLSGRKVGLFLFVMTNVATWYGGILGVGEFSFRYGLVSWFTQGFPYYIFAIIFAFLFAGKIRSASLFTIPDKLEKTYGTHLALLSAILIFILVSPAPYLLMLGQIISISFNISYLHGLLLAALVSSIYLLFGGYKSNILVDTFSFFVMFLGFIIIVVVAYSQFGGVEFFEQSLPSDHLSITGGTSPTFIIVWFLIALWTFTDPGFHQRCYSAKNNSTAKWGIIISVGLWMFFDFLTNTTGLYARAILPELQNPVLSFPHIADTILSPGLKGIFFAALIATVLSTSNSFLFLSATTFSRDFIYRYSNSIRGETSNNSETSKQLVQNTRIGIIISLVVSIIIAYFFESIVEMWYTIGSICIPGLIFLVISSYYNKYRIKKTLAFFESILAVLASIIWIILRSGFDKSGWVYQVEPMIVGLVLAVIFHMVGNLLNKKPSL